MLVVSDDVDVIFITIVQLIITLYFQFYTRKLKNRKRNITSFNSLLSNNASTNVGKNFLRRIVFETLPLGHKFFPIIICDKTSYSLSLYKASIIKRNHSKLIKPSSDKQQTGYEKKKKLAIAKTKNAASRQ